MCLSGLPPDRMLAYIDDIIVFNEHFDDHLKDLEAVFKRLRKAGISLKLSKCVFAASEVEYLGFVLSTDGIRPQRKLAEAIKTFAAPTQRKKLNGSSEWPDFTGNL